MQNRSLLEDLFKFHSFFSTKTFRNIFFEKMTFNKNGFAKKLLIRPETVRANVKPLFNRFAFVVCYRGPFTLTVC